ncbi:hypothetical protein M422DRAFT_275701 [Sphaerobolus stellatus SS14]|uniref:Uncharacterized protein n=1 Tax=Sphaerobolus stellatus (strain SS14) TaxID=990650 RepID=A0A0C9U3I2_SPHS4|nr:hypothetical protein M422DRAFT_275701 [Sphaerobolus stellatus SS14]
MFLNTQIGLHNLSALHTPKTRCRNVNIYTTSGGDFGYLDELKSGSRFRFRLRIFLLWTLFFSVATILRAFGLTSPRFKRCGDIGVLYFGASAFSLFSHVKWINLVAIFRSSHWK